MYNNEECTMNQNITKQELLSKLLLKKDAIAFRKANKKAFSYIWGTLKELEELSGEETTLDDFRQIYFAQHKIKPLSDTSEEMIEVCYENFKENAKIPYSQIVAKKTAMAEARWKKTRSSDSSIENNENVCYSTLELMQEQQQQQEQQQEKDKSKITSRETISQEQELDNNKSQEQEIQSNNNIARPSNSWLNNVCKQCGKTRLDHSYIEWSEHLLS